jgi:hypothetical protein
MNKFSKPWKMMHPYADHIGSEKLGEIEVSVLGKFTHLGPSGLCAVAYQHQNEETGKLDPFHQLSFTGYCIFKCIYELDGPPTLISDSPATFYLGDSRIYSLSNFHHGRPAVGSLCRIYRLES